jgi:hypothetical protein
MTMQGFRPELIERRFGSAIFYLQVLAGISCRREWLAGYLRFLGGNAPTEEALALAHPRHFSSIPEQSAIRGPRFFAERTSAEWCGCQSVLIWGYPCPLEDVTCEADHLFPYEAGGPTWASNRVWLCTTHNHVKSSDIHLFPWECGTPDWLAPRLAVVAAHLGRLDE